MKANLHLPGNKLLHDTWGDTRYGVQDAEDIGIFPPEKFESLGKIKSVRKPVEWAKDIDEDFEPDLEDTVKYEVREDVREILVRRGIHYLAWYQPYRYFGGKYWGIYFDVSAMDVAAQNLYLDVKRMNANVKFGLVLDCLYDIVLRHEVEHLVQELVITKYSPGPSNWLKLLFPGSRERDGIEISATHMEMFDTYELGSKKRGTHREMIRTAWSMTPRPHPYSKWDEREINQVEREFLAPLNINESGCIDEMRKNVGRRGQTKWIRVPIYYVPGTIPWAHVSPNSFPRVVNCRKLLKWFKSSKNNQICGVNFKLVPAGREPYKVLLEGARKSIPFTCHKKDMNTKFFKQIAEQIGVPVDTVKSFFQENL